jgi:hypothetical protein
MLYQICVVDRSKQNEESCKSTFDLSNISHWLNDGDPMIKRPGYDSIDLVILMTILSPATRLN